MIGKKLPLPYQGRCLGSILETELTLDQEGPELFGVHTIKGVQFTDFGTGGGRIVGTARGVGEAVDRDSEIVEDSQTRV